MVHTIDACRSFDLISSTIYLDEDDDVNIYRNNDLNPTISTETIDFVSFSAIIDDKMETTKTDDFINTSKTRPLCLCDGGANRSVTNDVSSLHHVVDITPHRIGGIGHGIKCTKKGWYDLISTNNEVLTVPMFYSSQATETVVSPTDVVNTYGKVYDSVLQNFDLKDGDGHLIFYKKDPNRSFQVHENEDILGFYKDGKSEFKISLLRKNNLYYIDVPVVHSIYNTVLRSQDDMAYAGVGRLALYDLWHYRLGHVGHSTMTNIHKHVTGVPSLKMKNPFFKCQYCFPNITKKMKGYSLHKNEATAPFQRLQMDFGFVQVKLDEHNNKLVRSRQGFGSYLLIVDEYTRFIWVFPTKSKSPPFDIIDQFLTQYKRSSGMRRVRTDLGKELARSKLVRATIAKHGYILEQTAPNSSFQNSKVERPHRTLGNMMRSMLKGANLDKSFWADALLHAVYLKNRLPHQAIGMTPYERMMRRKPDLSHLRIFGTKVIVKDKNIRNGKLTDNVIIGLFLRFTGTDRNIIFFDTKTNQTRSARHVEYDETHYHDKNPPPYAQRLQNLVQTEIMNQEIDDVLPKKLPQTHPTDSTNTSFPTVNGDIEPPAVVSDDENSVQKCLSSSNTQHDPRRKSGFGSTDVIHNISANVPNADQLSSDDLLLIDTPYDKTIKIKLKNRGNHPLRGLILEQIDDRIFLRNCEKSTPAARIPRWRSDLRHSILEAINGTTITTITEAKKLIADTKSKYVVFHFIPPLKLPSHPSENVPIIHFDQFLTMAHQHLAAKNDSEPWMDPLNPPDVTPDLLYVAQSKGHANTKLTRKRLKMQEDWPLWKIAEFQQLNQYKSQDMFGAPVPRPRDANVLPLIWVYVYKTNGVRKARCVCNGSPRMKGTVTLDHTYAAALEQTGSRIFWALSAIYNFVVSGSDASNAFAEAQAPKAKLYVTIDDVFRAWYTEIENKPPIPKNHVLPVNHALQGHPESPRLWARKIHSILTDLGYKNTTHEPCLYAKMIGDKPIFFLRQVDDFLISAPSEEISNKEFDAIQKGLREPMKRFGVVTAFNGTDIEQTENFIKVSCKTYISKILKGHGWENIQHSATTSTPMRSDSKYFFDLENIKGPTDVSEQNALAKQMNFSYRQAIGELLFAAITCRPDIMYPVVKLSQFSNVPAPIHFIAVKNIFRYLRATIDEGLHYWRNGHRKDLPFVANPVLLSDNYVLKHPWEDPKYPNAFVDSDWGGDTSNRKSITGVTIFMAGAPIMYRTRMQQTVALSSTEAEFVAASESGKMVLYVRSILDELGIHVVDATPMYVDNAGARMMANSQKPTRRTRHLDIRYFALTEWTEKDLILLKPISTSDNNSDALTKALGRQLFTRHKSTILGHRKPEYVRL